jgi:hypothetical protein
MKILFEILPQNYYQLGIAIVTLIAFGVLILLISTLINDKNNENT